VQVVEDDLDDAFSLSPADDGLLEKHGHHVGEKGENVEAHGDLS
jgi:hypothetical protein